MDKCLRRLWRVRGRRWDGWGGVKWSQVRLEIMIWSK